MTAWLTVVGIGEDGYAGLGKAARRALLGAECIVGAPRQLDLLPPCNNACPAGENIQEWLRLVKAERDEDAWRELTRNNPFPAIHGRVCYHPCETACNRLELDGSVSIHSVERYLGDLAIERGWTFRRTRPGTGRRVLVVGAGPSGLSAAYQLAMLGHEVEIRDASPEPGGMMRYGIPKYRLPRPILDAEIERIRAEPARHGHVRGDELDADAALFLDATTTVPGPEGEFVAAATRSPGRLRIALSTKVPTPMPVVNGASVPTATQLTPAGNLAGHLSALLPQFVRPLLSGAADYTKGNRFYRPESLRDMPSVRLFGNAVLSLMTKFSCGYWSTMDPTNGYTAVHTAVLRKLPLEKLERRYFFETDMLYHLNTIRAVVHDVPMDAVYGDEESNLKVSKVLPEFLGKHASRLIKRYVYLYLLRDFNIGSLYSLLGVVLCGLGVVFGGWAWLRSLTTGQPATSGTVMLAALPIIIGIQFVIAFLHHDVSSVPTDPLVAELDAG